MVYTWGAEGHCSWRKGKGMAAGKGMKCVYVVPGVGGEDSGIGLWKLNLGRGAVQLVGRSCSDSKNNFFEGEDLFLVLEQWFSS